MTHSSPDANGFEYMTCCVQCKVDEYGICDGIKVTADINIKKNTTEITKMRGAKYVETLARFKEDMLCESEFKKWLDEHGYNEDETECQKSRLIMGYEQEEYK